MRTAILCIVSVAVGVVGGATFTRMQYLPRVNTLAEQLADVEETNKRISSDLRFAAERLQWVEAENMSLREQTAALDGGAAPRPSVRTTAPSGATADSAGGETATAASSRPQGASGDARRAASSSGSPAADTAQAQDAAMEAAYAESFDEAAQARERVGDLIARDLTTAQDQATVDRLANIDAHLQQVRELYKSMSAAKTPEERAAIQQAVAQNRANLKLLVEQQQAAEMRNILERTGVSDPGAQRQIISSMRELRESPYWSDPMMIWGTAAPDAE